MDIALIVIGLAIVLWGLVALYEIWVSDDEDKYQ